MCVPFLFPYIVAEFPPFAGSCTCTKVVTGEGPEELEKVTSHIETKTWGMAVTYKQLLRILWEKHCVCVRVFRKQDLETHQL